MSAFKNIILILALGTVALMSVALYLYDYIPSGLTVSQASKYETNAKTTEILSDSQEAQGLLTTQNQSKSTKTSSTPIVKTNIVLREYEVSKADLAVYKQAQSYVPGKADPFAEAVTSEEGESGTPNGENVTSIDSSSSTVSDGTFYNSTRVK